MERIQEEFMLEHRAVAFLTDTYRQFPSSTYGTRLTKRRSRCGCFWEVVGQRFLQ